MRWRAALMAHEDACAPEPNFDAAELWDSLGDGADAQARERIVSALNDPHGHEALRLYVEVQRELAAVELASTEDATERRGLLITLVSVSAAAAALLVLFTRPPSVELPDAGTLRAPSVDDLDSSLDGRTLPRDRFLLRWAPAGTECRYDVRASTIEGDLVLQQQGLDVSQTTIPADRLPQAGRIVWQVDFACAEGQGSSRTFSTTVEP